MLAQEKLELLGWEFDLILNVAKDNLSNRCVEWDEKYIDIYSEEKNENKPAYLTYEELELFEEFILNEQNNNNN